MPAPFSLQFDLYDEDDALLWSVSTDPDHAAPYLMRPENYGTQEIDPIGAAGSLGTLEIMVADAPQTPGDQQSGWMTERLADVRGRRGRLRRFVGGTTWVTILDGPCAQPVMDESYAAYRWAMSDGRDRERTVTLFGNGASASIIPRGAIAGFGYRADTDSYLLPPVTPVVGVLNDGLVTLYDDTEDVPPELVVDEETEKLVVGEFQQVDGVDATVFPTWDVRWRASGSSDPWNVARPVLQAIGGTLWAGLIVASGTLSDGRPVRFVQAVRLFTIGTDPDGFPADDTELELVIRHRGPATASYPYYFEGTLGACLQALYTGRLTRPEPAETDGGVTYDPAGLDTVLPAERVNVRVADDALDALTTPVLLRMTEVVTDARAWAESALYAPSGWLPTLDDEQAVSPQSRARPAVIDDSVTLSNANCEPSPAWDAGERIIAAVSLTYRRYFVPPPELNISTEPDGLAVKDVTLAVEDVTALARYGDSEDTRQDYDGIAFGAVGDETGEALTGLLETGVALGERLASDVLARYAGGAPSIGVAIRRADAPNLRVGDWLPVQLPWFPGESTRETDWESAQVLAIGEDDPAWRHLLVEQSVAPYWDALALQITEDETESDPDHYRTYIVAPIDPVPQGVDSITLRGVLVKPAADNTAEFDSPSGIEDGVPTGTPTDDFGTTGTITVRVKRPSDIDADCPVQFIATAAHRTRAIGSVVVPHEEAVVTPPEVSGIGVSIVSDAEDTVDVSATITGTYDHRRVRLSSSDNPGAGTIEGAPNQTTFDLGALFGFDVATGGPNNRALHVEVAAQDASDSDLDSDSDDFTIPANDDY